MKDKSTILAFAEDFMNKVKSLWNPTAVTLTLSDGTVIEAPEEDWTGQPITLQDGSPLPPGDYMLEGGATFSIDENGNATSSPKEPEMAAEQTTQEPENDMNLKEENEQLKAKVAELESALQARNDASAKLEESKVKLEARAKDLEEKLNIKVKALTEELKKFQETTAGDTTPPDKGAKMPFQKEGVPVIDPMQQFFKQTVLDRRN